MKKVVLFQMYLTRNELVTIDAVDGVVFAELGVFDAKGFTVKKRQELKGVVVKE